MQYDLVTRIGEKPILLGDWTTDRNGVQCKVVNWEAPDPTRDLYDTGVVLAKYHTLGESKTIRCTPKQLGLRFVATVTLLHEDIQFIRSLIPQDEVDGPLYNLLKRLS